MNRFDRERWDTMGKEALSRVEELMNTSRINELIHKREEDEKKKKCKNSSRYYHLIMQWNPVVQHIYGKGGQKVVLASFVFPAFTHGLGHHGCKQPGQAEKYGISGQPSGR